MHSVQIYRIGEIIIIAEEMLYSLSYEIFNHVKTLIQPLIQPLSQALSQAPSQALSQALSQVLSPETHLKQSVAILLSTQE